MVALLHEPWFNAGMYKSEAIDLLGGEVSAAAEQLDISYQAVNKWPELLPPRISDRVLGVCLRKGIQVPARFFEQKQPPALTQQAQVATKDVAQGAAHA